MYRCTHVHVQYSTCTVGVIVYSVCSVMRILWCVLCAALLSCVFCCHPTHLKALRAGRIFNHSGGHHGCGNERDPFESDQKAEAANPRCGSCI